jgi:16S rRNA processing protein RimM
MTQSPKPELVLIAQIGAAHGIQGEFKLLSFMEESVSVLEHSPLLSEKGEPALNITAAREHKGQLLVRAKEAPDRTAVEKLVGLKLYIERADLPALEDEDDYYIADLIGLGVVDQAGEPFGRVAGVENFGAGDLLDLQPLEGPRVFIPFTRDAVPEVDMAAKRVVINRDYL